jgi:signal transduction histidine kinase
MIAGLLAMMVLLVGGIDAWLSYRDQTAQLELLQQAEAKAAAARIEEYLKAIEDHVRDVGLLPWTASVLNIEDQRDEYHRLLKLVPPIMDVWAVDPQGREKLFVSRIELDRRQSGRDVSKEAVWLQSRNRPVAYSPAYFRVGSEPFTSLSVTEQTKPNVYDGNVTIAEVNLKFVADVIASLKIGEQGKAYIVDGSKHLLAHPNLPLVLSKTDLSELPQLKQALTAVEERKKRLAAAPKPAVAPLTPADFGLIADTRGRPDSVPLFTRWAQSPEATSELAKRMAGGKGAATEEVYTTAYYLAGPEWLLFVEQPASEVMRPVYASLWRTLFITIASIVAAVIASRMLAKRLSQPILDLQSGAAKFGAGKLDTRVEIRTGDEVQSLADEFNRMASQLQDYTQSLERKVEEKTQELSRANLELQAANRHKSQFLANMSHELRTPLNAVIGFSDVLSREMFGKLNDRQRGYVGDINTSGQHLLSLINDILDLSKIEAGRMDLDVQNVELSRVFANALTLVRERATLNGLKLFDQSSDGPSHWVLDERKLKQMIVNLLSNAVKFTERGGSVTLVSQHVKEHGNEWLEIAVADTGIGISEADQAKVFEEFQQVGDDTDRKNQGSGLGLALVKRLVELHGGTVSLRSAVGRGSCFTLRFPKREA